LCGGVIGKHVKIIRADRPVRCYIVILTIELNNYQCPNIIFIHHTDDIIYAITTFLCIINGCGCQLRVFFVPRCDLIIFPADELNNKSYMAGANRFTFRYLSMVLMYTYCVYYYYFIVIICTLQIKRRYLYERFFAPSSKNDTYRLSPN